MSPQSCLHPGTGAGEPHVPWPRVAREVPGYPLVQCTPGHGSSGTGLTHLWWAGPQEPRRWQPACSRFQSHISSTLWHSLRGRRPNPKSCST